MGLPSGVSGWAWPAAWALCLAVVLAGIHDRDLWTPDEPRDAAISLEMSRTGRLIVPTLAGEPFVEKPPLYFVAAAACLRVLEGRAAPTAIIRGTSAVWGLATLAVTFLLARELSGRRSATIAVGVLATMFGFVLNSHWIRVDAALVFFVSAAALCLARAYIGGRFGWLVGAGLASAGAFLTKGTVALAYIGAVGLAPFVRFSFGLWKNRERRPHLTAHALGLTAALIPIAVWLWRFRVTGGSALWEEWLWENQLGRALGTSNELGHLRPGRPDYYLRTMLLFAMPWTPILLTWTARSLGALRRLRADQLMLCSWSLGTLLFLTLSVTKRDIYLAPLLPAFAVICAQQIEDGLPRWCRIWLVLWIAICFAALVTNAALPWLARGPLEVPERARAVLLAFSLRHLAASAILIFGAVWLWLCRRSAPLAARASLAMALVYLAALALPVRAVDAQKSMSEDVRRFVDEIPRERRSATAGFGLDETLRGSLYYYSGWSVPTVVGRRAVDDILLGKNPEFDGVLVGLDHFRLRQNQVPRAPFESRASATFGGGGSRGVVWIAPR